MTQYFTDFSEYTDAAQPIDWTERWVTANVTWTVQSSGEAGILGGKFLRVSPSSASARHGLSWNDIDGDVNRATVEVLMKTRHVGTAGQHDLRAFGRGSGAAAAEHAYVGGIRYDGVPVSGTTDLTEYTTGTYSLKSATNYPTTNGTWYWTRFRLSGTSLKVRVWEDGDPEPGTWSEEATDISISGAGWVGLFLFNQGGNCDVDYFAVGTNGDTAPSPASGAVSHDTSGALVGAGAALAGSAAHSALHATSGVLTGPGAALEASATHIGFHATSGVLAGAGSIVTGASSVSHFLTHTTSGALVGPGAVLEGAAQLIEQFYTSGALVGQGSVIAGSAARTRVHPTSGDLVANWGAVLTASATHTAAPVEHETSGALVGPGAVLDGNAFHYVPGGSSRKRRSAGAPFVGGPMRIF